MKYVLRAAASPVWVVAFEHGQLMFTSNLRKALLWSDKKTASDAYVAILRHSSLLTVPVSLLIEQVEDP